MFDSWEKGLKRYRKTATQNLQRFAADYSSSFDDWNKGINVLIHYEGTDFNTQSIVEICKRDYPEFWAEIAVPFGDLVFVNLVPKDADGFVVMEWHLVDLDKKIITGSIPVNELFDNEDFIKALNERSVKIDNSLEHHGIKGQKWGVRRWQNHDGSLTQAGREHYGYANKNNTTRYGGSAIRTAENAAKGVARIALRAVPGLSSVLAARDAIIAAKSVGDKIVTSFGKEEKSNQKLKKYADIDKTIESEKDVLKIEGPHDEKSDMAAVNPSYKGIMSRTGSINNCMFCTTTYDLRRRGYDVTAKAGFGRVTNDVTKWYKGAKIESSDSKTWKEFSQKLSLYPDGARGNLMVTPPKDFLNPTNVNFGHSMVWEKSGGKVVIRDAQVNKTYEVNSFYMKSKWDAKTAKYVRTDNCEPNWKALNECSANVRKKQ